MLLNGIEPPEIGTIKDRIMTRMFSMEQARKVEEMSTLGSLIASANRADQNVVNNIKSILEGYKETSGYNTWSNDSKNKVKDKEKIDSDMLDRVSKMT